MPGLRVTHRAPDPPDADGGGQDGRLPRLAEAERQWDGPIPEPALAVALAGSPERAQAVRRRARRRGLDRVAGDLRRTVARRRQALAAAALSDAALGDAAPTGASRTASSLAAPVLRRPAAPIPEPAAIRTALETAVADLAAFRHAAAEAMA